MAPRINPSPTHRPVGQPARLPLRRAASPDLISAPHTCSSNNNLLPCPTQFPEMHSLLLEPPWGESMPAGLSAPARAALPAAGKRSLVPPRRGGHLALLPAAKTRACRAGRRSGEGEAEPSGPSFSRRAQEIPLPTGAVPPAPPALRERTSVAFALPAPSIFWGLGGCEGLGGKAQP